MSVGELLHLKNRFLLDKSWKEFGIGANEHETKCMDIITGCIEVYEKRSKEG